MPQKAMVKKRMTKKTVRLTINDAREKLELAKARKEAATLINRAQKLRAAEILEAKQSKGQKRGADKPLQKQAKFAKLADEVELTLAENITGKKRPASEELKGRVAKMAKLIDDAIEEQSVESKRVLDDILDKIDRSKEVKAAQRESEDRLKAFEMKADAAKRLLGLERALEDVAAETKRKFQETELQKLVNERHALEMQVLREKAEIEIRKKEADAARILYISAQLQTEQQALRLLAEKARLKEEQGESIVKINKDLREKHKSVDALKSNKRNLEDQESDRETKFWRTADDFFHELGSEAKEKGEEVPEVLFQETIGFKRKSEDVDSEQFPKFFKGAEEEEEEEKKPAQPAAPPSPAAPSGTTFTPSPSAPPPPPPGTTFTPSPAAPPPPPPSPTPTQVQVPSPGVVHVEDDEGKPVEMEVEGQPDDAPQQPPGAPAPSQTAGEDVVGGETGGDGADGRDDLLSPDESKTLLREEFQWRVDDDKFFTKESRGKIGYGQGSEANVQPIQPFGTQLKPPPDESKGESVFKQKDSRFEPFRGQHEIVNQEPGKPADAGAGDEEIMATAQTPFAKIGGQIIWIPFYAKAVKMYFTAADFEDLVSNVTESRGKLKLKAPDPRVISTMQKTVDDVRSSLKPFEVFPLKVRHETLTTRYAEWLELRQIMKAVAKYQKSTSGMYNQSGLFSGNLREAVSKAIDEAVGMIGKKQKRTLGRGLEGVGPAQGADAGEGSPAEFQAFNPFQVNEPALKKSRTTLPRFF